MTLIHGKDFIDGEEMYSQEHFKLVERLKLEAKIAFNSKRLQLDNILNQEITKRFLNYEE
jgi:hypothetical protein